MRLTLPFFFGMKLPNGHLFRGKRRLVKRVSHRAIETLKKDMQREEQNLFYLRHPYLTREQSAGHSKALNKHQKWVNQFITAANDKFSKHKTLRDELEHLKIGEDWDFKAGAY
ncbi:hypothetical protein AAG570_008832 [Ranatra chinensis]|uniref:Ribosomal protein 63, mitochondrial n=1 Tax=Ranatra chinensis TaxID=642074 RepID=A0ABD0YS09_9HEMI